MIFEHEIPKGSRLYFGASAKRKRVLENQVCDILENSEDYDNLTNSTINKYINKANQFLKWA